MAIITYKAMSTAQANIGYKAFILTDTGYRTAYGDEKARYHLGETYTMNCDKESLELCKRGYHYCLNVADTHYYYGNNAIITKIEILGDVLLGNNKCCTNKYKIIELFNGETTSKYGTTYHYKNGLLNSEGDLPAYIYSDDSQHWYKNGKLHREGDQPAIINSSGTKKWYKNGKLHREGDQPAIIYSSGIQEWYKDGERIK